VPTAGFLDNRTLGEQISLAAGWGRRRAPSLIDVGQAKLLMWDGRHDALYSQPFGPLESPVEMNSSRLFAAEQIYALYQADYEAIFGAMPPFNDTTRFPPLSADLTGCQPSTVDPQPTCNGTEHGMPGDDAEFDGLAPADQDAVTRVVVNVGKALGAYERLLSCGPGRFDQWMHGQADALSDSEQRGAEIFVGPGKCVTCHSGPYFSDQQFHNVGLLATTVAVVFVDDADPGAIVGLAEAIADPLNVAGQFSDGNDGRLPKSVTPTMNGAFRTPTLRCASRRPTFMHTGQLSSFAEVVAFFAQGGNPFGYLGTSEIAPLGLSAQDQEDLVAFLATLDGPGPDASLEKTP
jgi:cytochrome c peroxidase